MDQGWTNSRGNNCEVKRFESRNTDYYDQKFQNTNWERFDTINDTSNFGVWINSSQLKVIVFEKGEEKLISCKNLESFRAELAELRALYRTA